MSEQHLQASHFDLTNFTIREMSACGRILRTLGIGMANLQETASRIVSFFHESLVDGDGEQASVLVRFYQTRPFAGLDAELQNFSQRLLGNTSPPPDMKCLVLMGTAGEAANWNCCRTSRDHRAIPLPSEEAVHQVPMVSNLITHLGLPVAMVVRPNPRLLLDQEQKTYNVFHVPEAYGSPFIPAQEDFVVPYGVRSVLGFGGLLPSGEMFAVILFFKVPVTAETAQLFRALSLNVKIAVLPFDRPALY